MKYLYTFFIYLYIGLVRIVAIYNAKAAKMIKGREQDGKLIKSAYDSGVNIWNADSEGVYDWQSQSQSKVYWVHCSSLGEFEQGRPIIEEIKQREPNSRVLLTFFSPSGYEPRKNYPIADKVMYMPFDTPSNAKKFIKAIDADVAIFVKYEFWGNFLMRLAKDGVRCYIVSAIFRESMPFFRFYGGFFRRMLRCYDWLFVQNQESKDLLSEIGVDRVTVCGDTRFDRVVEIVESAPSLPIIDQFEKISEQSHRRIMVGGSVWQADLDMVLELVTAKDAMSDHIESEWNLILAPHEIHQDQIKQIIDKFDQGLVVRYTELTSMTECQRAEAMLNCRILLIDCIGILSSVYRVAYVSYIGGGFGVGIHNILEAATWGSPVIFGPNYMKFKEARDLIKLSGAFSVKAVGEFMNIVRDLDVDHEFYLTASDTCKSYVMNGCGATQTILNRIMHK